MLALFKSVLPFLTDATPGANLDGVSGVVDNVDKLSGTISENGPLIVICAVFILVFILIFLLFLRINNAMIKSVIEQIEKKNTENSDITSKLLNHVLEDEDDEDNQKKEDNIRDEKTDEDGKSKDLVSMFINYNIIFKSAAKTVLNELRCDRVAIYVFHNGNKTLYGLPFIKMSCIFELTMKGTVTMRGRSHSNLPLHLFNDFIEKLYENHEFSGNLDNVEIHDNSIREFLAFSDAKAVFMKAIVKDDGSLAGFTVCEFNKDIDFTNEEIYKKIKYVTRDMNNSIKYIITDDVFSKKYEDDK